MIHEPGYVKMLLRKYTSGTISQEELATLLLAWDIYDDEELSEMIAEVTGEYKDSEIKNLSTEQPRKKYFKLHIGSWLKHTAIFITVFTALVLLVRLLGEPQQLKYVCNGISGDQVIPTGPYTCRVLLDDNCSILVDSSFRGLIVRRGGMKISQTAPGIIQYELEDGVLANRADSVYHAVETSAGQQYIVKLPDGSTVRLNAASSVHFTAGYKRGSRRVELAGEALFDVVEGAEPFYVKALDVEFTVTGTTFNIKAYSESPIATLLTGSMEVKSNSARVKLQPGQKVEIIKKRSIMGPKEMVMDSMLVSTADVKQLVSWKNVNRVYANAPVREVVSDMGRWYDLEIVNFACIPDHARITAAICYDIPAEEFLRMLRKSGLRFYSAGKSITFCAPAMNS